MNVAKRFQDDARKILTPRNGRAGRESGAYSTDLILSLSKDDPVGGDVCVSPRVLRQAQDEVGRSGAAANQRLPRASDKVTK